MGWRGGRGDCRLGCRRPDRGPHAAHRARDVARASNAQGSAIPSAIRSDRGQLAAAVPKESQGVAAGHAAQLVRSRQSQVQRLPIPCSLRSTSRSSRRMCRTPSPRGSSRPARNVLVAAHARRHRVALPQLPRQAGSRPASRRVEAKVAGASARSKHRLNRGVVLHPRSRLAIGVRTRVTRRRLERHTGANPSRGAGDAPVHSKPERRGSRVPGPRRVRRRARDNAVIRRPRRHQRAAIEPSPRASAAPLASAEPSVACPVTPSRSRPTPMPAS